MATSVECPAYADCAYIKWRKLRPDAHMVPLPDDGDCGKIVEECGRLNPNNPIQVTTEGPQTWEEIDMAFPLRPNKNNRPPRRLVGGGE